MQHIQKTNAARILDRSGVKYRLIPYEVDENNLAAGHVAEELGEDIKRVFKTLVLHGVRCGHFVCVVPGDAEVDLKKAARVAGDKKVELIAVKELLPLTGYIRGGCSPLGMKKKLPTYFHESAARYDEIYVSAGVRGLQICASPEGLLKASGAVYADLIKDSDV
ncbi:MAG: Cys-tRNA(Pro) deacylase [Muribaculaceae bacterium]|nr:Cys-tRNA(Pro) deacylase [Muribaculaceae bacterium]